MRPVNLLPEGDRSRRPAAGAGTGNASWILIGVLGALLLGVVGFVMTQNQITSATSDIARAEQEKAEAEQRAASLAAFGDFAQIKATRVNSVTQLAQARFDWERLMRELALVLPEGTSLTEVTASSSEAADGTTPEAGAVGAAPSVTLKGCADSQPRVAVAMVRLRQLHRATDVELRESVEEDDESSSGSGGPLASPAPAADAATDPTDCPDYTFEVTVSFDPAAPDSDAPGADTPRVPAALGGGA